MPFVHAGLALLYSLVFMRCYVSFLNPQFEYAGFTLFARDIIFLVQSVMIAVGPIVLYRGLREISSVVAVFIYLLLYVPIVLTFALGSTKPIDEITIIQVTFLAGMCLLFLVDRLVLKSPFYLRAHVNLMAGMLLLTVAATAYVLFKYWGNLRFASFGEAVYEQRSANAGLGTDLVTRYLTSWLSTVLVPLCLAYGLVARRYVFLVAGAAACLMLYMAAAAKIAIVLPVLFVGFYALFAGRRLAFIYPILVSGLIVVMGAANAVRNPDSAGFLFSSLLLWRTVGNGGQLTSAYYDFFASHPHTNYSHITLVQYFTHSYPYGSDGLGQVVGKFYWNDLTNANASFWATDGIAAMGLPGVLASSIGCAFLLVVMNSITRGYNRMFIALCFLPAIVSLLNTSLFSTLWTGGVGFLTIFLIFNRPEARLNDPDCRAG